MITINRRQLLRQFAITAIAINLPAVSGCQTIQPQPFTTGRTITPPQGCSELLTRDARGYC